MGIAPALVLALSSGVCALTPVSDLKLHDTMLRIRDVVTADCVRTEPRIGNLIIASAPRDRDSITLARVALANLIRHRAPEFASLQLAEAAGSVHISFEPRLQRPPLRERPCFRAAASITARQPITRDDLEPAPCAISGQGASIRYDHVYGVVRAASDIATGTYLGRVAVYASRFPDTGDVLTLSATSGSVRVDRMATALQPAPRGRALFVRTQDGDVFSAPTPRTP